ncbi:cell division protein FtsL [Thioalkalivibrio denitrificans]|uniref:cell division protein FtsL n=1 Tax=Thioalkalivibrio denitrificans TaxID=108003 RepID=UPI0026D752C8
MTLRLTGLAALFLAVIVSALGVVYSKHHSRGLFIALQEELDIRDRLNVEWGQLQLEQSTWATHGRIEEVARGRLEMTLPDARTTVILLE